MSHRQYIFADGKSVGIALGGEKRKAEVIPVGLGSCVCIVVCVGCTCKPRIRQSRFASEEENCTFFLLLLFLYTSFGVRIAPGLISHVYDTGQLAVWHRKELAELVDYLPK